MLRCRAAFRVQRKPKAHFSKENPDPKAFSSCAPAGLCVVFQVSAERSAASHDATFFLASSLRAAGHAFLGKAACGGLRALVDELGLLAVVLGLLASRFFIALFSLLVH